MPGRRAIRSEGLPTMSRAIAVRCSRRTAGRSFFTRAAKESGVSGWWASTVYPVMSPKGDRVAYIGDDGRSAFTVPYAPGKTVEPIVLEGAVVDGKYFTPMDWSRDGTRLAG